MKKFLRLICLILVVAICLSVPVFAEEESSTWGSAYFVSYSTYLYKTTGTRFQVWFEVVGRDVMDEIGVSEIQVQRSADGSTWYTMKTYTPDNYPQMIGEDTGAYADCVTYTGTAGYEYRAYVTFYAKKDNGIGKRFVYAYYL